jgi:hypothetical protein
MKAAEAMGFRGLPSSLSHLWEHRSGNVWPSDFKSGKKPFSKDFSFASLL